MTNLELGRLLRLLRLRHGWRLRDLAVRSGLSAATLGRHELGAIASVERVRQHGAALDAKVEFRVVGRGGDLPRLLDDEHAAIVSALAAAFRDQGSIVEPEASFSQWGERGRIDLLVQAAPPRGALLVVEVKTELADLQDLLGGMSVKARLAPTVARELGWAGGRVVTVLALAHTARNRAMVDGHRSLFTPFARTWFRGRPPAVEAGPVLLWIPPRVAGRRRWLAGRRRVRRRANSPPRGLTPGAGSPRPGRSR
jgi:transcriptional regulator with XRE-family HTH domain